MSILKSKKSKTETRGANPLREAAPKIKVESWDEFSKKRKAEKLEKAGAKGKKEEPLYKKKEDSINYSVKDGLYTSIKSGLTSSFVMPFAIAMNATTGMLALLSSVPGLVAAFLQLFSQESMKFFKTRSRLIFLTAFIQSMMWLPLLFIPIFVHDNVPLAYTLILIFVTLESTIGTFQGPILNSMLADIIDEDKRGEFFGKRNRIVNFMGFVSTLVAGLVLSFFKSFDTNGTAHYVFFGFGILFVLAFISRLISSFYKKKMYDPPYTPKIDDITFWKFMKNMTHNNYGIFVMYVFLFQMAANVSAPFFALYLLRDMQFSYLYFTMISGISILTSFIAMGMWGKTIDKRGSKFVLTLSGFLVPFSPFLLVLALFIKNPTTLFIYILCEEAFSGIVWAGFNLSTSSFLFDATSKDERVKYISYYNLLIGIAVFLGAMLGSTLLKIYPSITMAATLVVTAIPIIYITTGLLRLTVTLLFMKKVHEARMVEVDFSGRGFFHRVVSINPRSHNQVMIMSAYENPADASFHNIIPAKKTSENPKKNLAGKEKKRENAKLSEKEIYEKKSVEYYRQNAMKTMNQKDKQVTPKDDSDNIEKNIEKDRKKIQDMVEGMKKGK